MSEIGITERLIFDINPTRAGQEADQEYIFSDGSAEFECFFSVSYYSGDYDDTGLPGLIETRVKVFEVLRHDSSGTRTVSGQKALGIIASRWDEIEEMIANEHLSGQE
tara:strand:- start:6621 stop:6944 length:324 start_codon:yes stop_codon:yes gene_type:complete